MRLLIITQKVDKNDDNLGFFHRWVLEFTKYYEFITVICLEEGNHDFYSVKNAESRSENSVEFSGTGIKVLSLGKEKFKIQNSKFKILAKLKYFWKFYKYILQFRNDYDTVFVHMNPVYVVLGGLFWKLWNKKVGLWYTHKSIDMKLRIAEVLVDHIFTASDKSFRLNSKKLYVMGHGIDKDEFESKKSEVKNNKVNILHVGRITRAKNIHLFVRFAEILKDDGIEFQINIIGDSITKEDGEYLRGLQEDISEKGLKEYFNFFGPMSPKERSSVFKENDVFINLSDTGSMDKTVLEAIVSGTQVLVSNEAFEDILPNENKTTKDPKQIAEDIQKIASTTLDPSLREYVLKNHNLENLIKEIANKYK